jgi:hypothetical protein
MSSPVVSNLTLPKANAKGRAKKIADIVPTVDPAADAPAPADAPADAKPKAKGKGRAKKIVDTVTTDPADSADPPANDDKPKPKRRAKKTLDTTNPNPNENPTNPPLRKNLIAKHALLHAFTFFLANHALQHNVFDKTTFDLFLRSSHFFDDLPLLLSFFQNLDLLTILKDSKIALKTYLKEKNGKAKKQPKTKKSDANSDKPTDLISSLVNLANSKEPIANPSSPANVIRSTDGAEAAPGAPVKQKRKYNRKPKTVAISEELSSGDE